MSKPERKNRSGKSQKVPITTGVLGQEYFQPYADYARTLRAWLVAYGIGAPVIFLGNEKMWDVLRKSGKAGSIGPLFLVGVALQVVITFLNKFSMWALYYGEIEASVKNRWYYKAADWFSDKIIIDIVVDLATITILTLATWNVLRIVFAGDLPSRVPALLASQ